MTDHSIPGGLRPVLFISERDAIVCPQCGGYATHLNVVEVSNEVSSARVVASGEDDRSRINISIGPGGGGRRHTVRLVIDCEEQWCRTIIDLRQHKGDTEWHRTDLKVENDEDFGR